MFFCSWWVWECPLLIPSTPAAQAYKHLQPKQFVTFRTRTLTNPNLTFEPLDQFQSVLHENNLEFSGQSNGTISNSPRVSLEKLRPKTVWSDGTQTLTQPNLTLEPLDQF